MVNGVVTLRFGSQNLGFECGDPRIELGDRERVEILARKERHRVARAWRRRDLVGVHRRERRLKGKGCQH